MLLPLSMNCWTDCSNNAAISAWVKVKVDGGRRGMLYVGHRMTLWRAGRRVGVWACGLVTSYSACLYREDSQRCSKYAQSKSKKNALPKPRKMKIQHPKITKTSFKCKAAKIKNYVALTKLLIHALC